METSSVVKIKLFRHKKLAENDIAEVEFSNHFFYLTMKSYPSFWKKTSHILESGISKNTVTKERKKLGDDFKVIKKGIIKKSTYSDLIRIFFCGEIDQEELEIRRELSKDFKIPVGIDIMQEYGRNFVSCLFLLGSGEVIGRYYWLRRDLNKRIKNPIPWLSDNAPSSMYGGAGTKNISLKFEVPIFDLVFRLEGVNRDTLIWDLAFSYS